MPETGDTTDAAAGAAADGAGAAGGLVLHLDGFEGPLDLLLELARGQKVDLSRISILALVEQYLAVVEGARRVRLELAAEWLVMAAWLAWLKSRLLLPADEVSADEGEQAAGMLAERLQELHAIRRAAAWLGDRPHLGHDVFARGMPEDHVVVDRSRLLLDTPGLVRAYLSAMRRAGAGRGYRPAPVTLWSVQDALARLGAVLGRVPEWLPLERFLPPGLGDALHRRAALASTLLAGLEMARGGGVELWQDESFGPIRLRAGQGAGPGQGAGEGGVAAAPA